MDPLQKARLVVKAARMEAEKAIHAMLRTGQLTVAATTSEKVGGRIKPVRSTLYDGVPCLLSFKGSDTQDIDLHGSSSGAMTLYVSMDTVIPENSDCVVEQNGETYRFKSAKGKAYEYHREYDVDFEKGVV